MRLGLDELAKEIIGAGSLRELAFERRRPLPEGSYSRVDIVVEGKVSDRERPLALPSPQRGEGSELLLPRRGHDAASCPLPYGVRGIFMCLRLGGLEVGLPVNLHVPVLKEGSRTKVL